MATYEIETEVARLNPLDALEQVISSRAWPFDRPNEDELSLVVASGAGDFHLSFTWSDDLESLQLACALDIKVSTARLREIHALLALINERLWIGHFDLWSEDKVLLFRHGLLLQGGAQPTSEQCEALIQFAVEACERFYPCFQFVLWGGKSAEEAVAAAMLDCVGEA